MGEIHLKTVYGQDPVSKQWLCPVRELWGLSSHERMSPVLEEKLCFTATQTGSYESAAQVAQKWGVEVDDSTIQWHVQQAGDRARAQCEERTDVALEPSTRGQVVERASMEIGRERFSLVLMLDGWMSRYRGEQWGLKPADAPGERVAWHEIKSGIVFRIEDQAKNQSNRGSLMRKYYVSMRGDAQAIGRRLHAEALRRGLAQARRVYVVADGAVWIWNVVEDRFSHAIGVLDFYHASQQLWAVAKDLYGETAQARVWVEPLLHQLRHGQGSAVVEGLEQLLHKCRSEQHASTPLVATKLEYFNKHRERIDYEKTSAQGCPCGSGAMESTCGQLQNRFKRTGQFWTQAGQSALMELEIARRNGDWFDIWIPKAA